MIAEFSAARGRSMDVRGLTGVVLAARRDDLFHHIENLRGVLRAHFRVGFSLFLAVEIAVGRGEIGGDPGGVGRLEIRHARLDHPLEDLGPVRAADQQVDGVAVFLVLELKTACIHAAGVLGAVEDDLAGIRQPIGDLDNPFGVVLLVLDTVPDEIVDVPHLPHVRAGRTAQVLHDQNLESVPVEAKLVGRRIGLVDFGMADQRLVDPFVEGGFIPVGRERVSANNLGFAILRARPGLFVDLGLVIAEGHLEPFLQTLGEGSQEALSPSVVALQGAMPCEVRDRRVGPPSPM